MAKFLSQIVSEIRGSIAGATFSRNSSGAYIRGRVAPVNANTPEQNVVRAQFGEMSSQWRDLTPQERQSWRELAQANPVTDSLGQPVTLSGLMYFVKLNVALLQIGQPINLEAPTIPEFPFVQIHSTDLESEVSTGAIQSAAIGSVGLAAAVTGYTLLVRATAVLSNGVSFFSRSQLKQITAIASPTAALVETALSTGNAYENVFTVPQPLGSYQVGFEYVLVHNASGAQQVVGRPMGHISVVTP